MRAEKLTGASQDLGRAFHADVFWLAESPPAWVLMFGGSGQTRDEYESRRETMVPIFNSELAGLQREGLGLGFIYVTAPWDISFPEVQAGGDLMARWNRHVQHDILTRLGVGAFYGAAYSGGAALLLAGLHSQPECFGVSLLGGDLIPADLEQGPTWAEHLIAVYNLQDGVYASNRETLQGLSNDGVVRVVRQKSGGHALKDYVTNGSWAGVLRRAWRGWLSR